MAFTESFAPFFADFGVLATLNGAPVRGVFDAAYGDAFGMVSGNSPVFRLPSSVAVAIGDTLLVNAITYQVVVIEADGTGMTTLRLEQQ